MEPNIFKKFERKSIINSNFKELELSRKLTSFERGSILNHIQRKKSSIGYDYDHQENEDEMFKVNKITRYNI